MSLIIIGLLVVAIVATVLIVANHAPAVKAEEKAIETDATTVLNGVEKKL